MSFGLISMWFIRHNDFCALFLYIFLRRRTRIMYQHLLLGYIVCVEVFDFEVVDGDRVVQCNVLRLFDSACRSVFQSDFITDLQIRCISPAMSFHIKRMLIGRLDRFSIDGQAHYAVLLPDEDLLDLL